MNAQQCGVVKIMIADDSAMVRERLWVLLAEIPGVEIVGQADDVQPTIDAVARLAPDVLILDLRMPGGTGLEVLDRIKRDAGAPVVIVLTNYSELPYRRRCLQAGADFFFDKTIEFERVADVIRALSAKPNPEARKETAHGSA